MTPPGAPATADELNVVRARRTAFVARFIVLREGKKTRAHRRIERMTWEPGTSAEDLHLRFRRVFLDNGDALGPVDRDLDRALAHSRRSVDHFVTEYVARSTLCFVGALLDYERSNALLFGAGEHPRPGGWRLPRELTPPADGNRPSAVE